LSPRPVLSLLIFLSPTPISSHHLISFFPSVTLCPSPVLSIHHLFLNPLLDNFVHLSRYLTPCSHSHVFPSLPICSITTPVRKREQPPSLIEFFIQALHRCSGPRTTTDRVPRLCAISHHRRRLPQALLLSNLDHHTNEGETEQATVRHSTLCH
jgi:hypothetical protein